MNLYLNNEDAISIDVDFSSFISYMQCILCI